MEKNEIKRRIIWKDVELIICKTIKANFGKSEDAKLQGLQQVNLPCQPAIEKEVGSNEVTLFRNNGGYCRNGFRGYCWKTMDLTPKKEELGLFPVLSLFYYVGL